jgi:L-ascorbate metabolism protein UlaG (beta-lactamase superfamily)
MNLSRKARIELIYQEDKNTYLGELDCRLLFLGENYRLLLETYPKAIDLFKKELSINQLETELKALEHINQLYNIYKNDNNDLAIRLYKNVLFQKGKTDTLPFYLKLSNNKNTFLIDVTVEKLKLLAEFWPLVVKAKDYKEIEVLLDKAFSSDQVKWLKHLLSKIIENNIFTASSNANNFFANKVFMPRVVFLGHSSLLFQSEQENILVDPILLFTHGLGEKAFEVTQIKISAILCSHSHWDHCHFQTLMFFDKSIPIFIPKVTNASGFNPPMLEALEVLGFTDVREVNLWEAIYIGEVEIVPIPFYGEEDEPNVLIEHYTYILKTKGFTVYGGVDSYRDNFGNMLEVLEKVKNLYRPDIAFLPVSKMVYSYETGGVNGFCSYFDPKLFGKSFQYTADPKEASEWTKVLGVKYVVPYATFVFSRNVSQSNFFSFANNLKNIGIGKKLCPLLPLDFISANNLKQNFSFIFSRRLIKFWLKCCVAYENVYDKLRKLKRFILK